MCSWARKLQTRGPRFVRSVAETSRPLTYLAVAPFPRRASSRGPPLRVPASALHHLPSGTLGPVLGRRELRHARHEHTCAAAAYVRPERFSPPATVRLRWRAAPSDNVKGGSGTSTVPSA